MGGKVGKALKKVGREVEHGVEHLASGAVHEAVKIGREVAEKAIAANDGPLTTADIELLQTRWSHMVALAQAADVTIPVVQLPTSSDEAAAFITNISTFEEQLEDVANEGMTFFTDMRAKYPCKPSDGLYDRTALSEAEREREAVISGQADAIGLDAALDFEVTANAAGTGVVNTIGIDPALGAAAITNANSKPMESPHGLPHSAKPKKMTRQSAVSQRPVSSEVMGEDGVHRLTVVTVYDHPGTQFSDQVKGDTDVVAETFTLTGAAPAALTVEAIPERYLAYAGCIPSPELPMVTAWPSDWNPNNNAISGKADGETLPVFTPDDQLIGDPFSPKNSRIVFVPHVANPPDEDGNFEDKRPGSTVAGGNASTGAKINLGQGVELDTKVVWGHHVRVEDTLPSGDTKVLRPGDSDWDGHGSIIQSLHVEIDLFVEVSIPHYWAEVNGKGTKVGVWLSELTTRNCEYVEFDVAKNATGWPNGDYEPIEIGATIKMNHHIRVAVGEWLVTGMIWTTQEYTPVPCTLAPFNTADGWDIQNADADPKRRRGSPSSDFCINVTAKIVTTERAGQTAIANQIESIKTLGGDEAMTEMETGADVWYIPHKRHGGPHAATRNFKTAAPGDHMAVVRGAVSADLNDRGVDAADALEKWVAWTGDITWRDMSWDQVHTASITNWLSAPQATATETGWDHELVKLRDALAGVTDQGEWLSDGNNDERIARLTGMRRVMGPAINLTDLIRTIGYGANAKQMADVYKIRLSTIMLTRQTYFRIKDHMGVIADAGIAATVASSSVGQEVTSQIVGEKN